MLNKRLMEIHQNLNKYWHEDISVRHIGEEVNLVLDIETSPNETWTEARTYSTAIMSIDDNSDICYFYCRVDMALEMLLNIKAKKVNVYIHNLFYDIKPFIIRFIEKYGNSPIKDKKITKRVHNKYDNETKELTFISNAKQRRILSPYTYSLTLKKGQLYRATFYGKVNHESKSHQPVEINFFDTYKILPYSLQKACSAFCNLELPKDGLDYEKVRGIGDELTYEEKVYIYNDVYGLKYLCRQMIVEGFDVNGKHVQYKKITNSSQSLSDYKETLMEDYQLKQNAFADTDFYELVDHRLWTSSEFEKAKTKDKQNDILFKSVFPPLDYFTDSKLRHSYFGGLSTVDFKNVEKYSKEEVKIGQVYDVNSLYPYQMESKLLPWDKPVWNDCPYEEMDKDYQITHPLYVQEIYIYDMKVKKNKMAFVQVKDDKDFNGREIITENRNLKGKKVPIRLMYSNVLMDLLFECYDVRSYELGYHFAFKGKHDLFKNYLTFWAEVKKTEKGAKREIAKLRQNALYGKFGSSGDNEELEVEIVNSKFTTIHTKEEYVTDNIYLPMAVFITSYAKVHLVQAINANRERFMYCDTDSMHLFGTQEQVKGIDIDDYKYGAWAHEMEFIDFKYIGSKRYAEKSKDGKWDIKCCGLNDKIMKQVDDIAIFDNCEYTSKELKKVKLYTKKNSIYYYKDKDCTKKIVGLIKSKKSKLVKGGTLIIEQPYMISSTAYYI